MRHFVRQDLFWLLNSKSSLHEIGFPESYAKWSKGRQDRLDSLVSATWKNGNVDKN